MKRVVIAIIALAAVSSAAFAQKNEESAKKAIAVAKAACENPKKSGKSATWLKLAKAYMDAYRGAEGKGIVGTPKAIVEESMGSIKPIGTSQETIGNNSFEVIIYPNSKYYYSADGTLRLILVTKPFVENALDEALAAYSKAAALDPSGKSFPEISKGIDEISGKFNDAAATAFNLRDFANAAVSFEKAVKASVTEPLAKVDTAGNYNAALSYDLAGNSQKAEEYYEECIRLGYYSKGDVFARLAECYKRDGAADKCKSTLENGFVACPENQGVLVGLINLYRDNGEDPNKIIALLDKAKVNDAKNASLYYVEGDICYKQLKDRDRAIEAYNKCTEVDPTYAYGEIGKAIIYNDEAAAIQEKANNEFNEKKYLELADQFEIKMFEALGAFEKAYNISNDNELKKNLAEYIKGIYFRFREKSPDYQAAYEKYAEVAKNGVK